MSRDFSGLLTERRNPRTGDLDLLSIPQIIDAILREDARVVGAVRRERASIARAALLLVRRLRRGGRIFFAGAGTSGRLGVLEAAELPPTFNIPRALAQGIMAGGRGAVFASKEGAEDDAGAGARELRRRRLRRDDTLVAIAASGVTPFVHGALREAGRRGAGRILVTCNKKGVKAAADVIIAPLVGPEVITGSTRLRAGTATKMVLNMLSVAAMVRMGKVYGNLMVDLQPKSEKLMARARTIVRTVARVPEARASKALEEAGGNAKVAIVMLRQGLTRRGARKLLEAHGGFLRGALEC